MQDKIKKLLKDIQSGDYKSLARGITLLENEGHGYEELLLGLEHRPSAKLVGITGPPGAGKSTLVNALLRYWTGLNKKVAIIAIDPSSPFNYGALLGDRIRMSEFYNEPNVFIRSLASRGALGGLSAKILEITDLVKNAAFDYIVVETVGVGQSEVEIAGLADCTVVALVPESGDEVQTLKSGIMEIADIFVVNKSDRGGSEALYRALRSLTHEMSGDGPEIPVIRTVATTDEGISELAAQIGRAFAADTGPAQKRLQLLAEKSWHWMQMQRMKGLDKTVLLQKLEEAVKTPDFNLYAFSREFLSGKYGMKNE